MSYLVVAYFTENTPYEQEVLGLIESLHKFNIPYYIRGVPSRSNWVLNTGIKPEFIYEMMGEHLDKDIVYVDSDAIIRQMPILFDDFKGDIGVHYKDGKELLSGTIFLKNNAKTRMMVRKWVQYQCNNKTIWDQKTLQRIISSEGMSLGMDVVNLPASYTQIFDSMAHNGKPVIEHFQASRRFKKLLTPAPKISDSSIDICGVSVRVLPDGSYYLPRRNKEVEEYLNNTCTKVHNELRWWPHPKGCNPITDLDDIFENKECYIIGKGPSLDFLTLADMPIKDAPILCINETIHKVETLNPPNPVFILQQDAWLKNKCLPKYGTMIIARTCMSQYEHVKNKYIFAPEEIGLYKANITVIFAIAIAKRAGTTKFNLISFDAATHSNVDYANCIGYSPIKGGQPSRFLGHRIIILKNTVGYEVNWITPTLPLGASVCTLSQ